MSPLHTVGECLAPVVPIPTTVRHTKNVHRMTRPDQVRVLIIPGLHDSGPRHWQTWLQRQYRDSRRVNQHDWHTADLDSWAAQIESTIRRDPGSVWIAAAHSFGCLALAHYLGNQRRLGADPRIEHALMVAPANPRKFAVEHRLGDEGLGVPSTLIASEDDPWMSLEDAAIWGRRWGSRWMNLGAVGHINDEAGFHTWPLSRYLVDQQIRHRQRRRRLELAHPLEFYFAV